MYLYTNQDKNYNNYNKIIILIDYLNYSRNILRSSFLNDKKKNIKLKQYCMKLLEIRCGNGIRKFWYRRWPRRHLDREWKICNFRTGRNFAKIFYFQFKKYNSKSMNTYFFFLIKNYLLHTLKLFIIIVILIVFFLRANMVVGNIFCTLISFLFSFNI